MVLKQNPFFLGSQQVVTRPRWLLTGTKWNTIPWKNNLGRPVETYRRCTVMKAELDKYAAVLLVSLSCARIEDVWERIGGGDVGGDDRTNGHFWLSPLRWLCNASSRKNVKHRVYRMERFRISFTWGQSRKDTPSVKKGKKNKDGRAIS